MKLWSLFFGILILLCACKSNNDNNDLIIFIHNDIRLELGQSRHEIETAIGYKLDLIEASLLYLSEPDEIQLERDIVASGEIQHSKNKIIYLGFNANDILIELRILKIMRLYQDQD